MSKCIYHTACPNCRSMGRDNHGDNLGVYEDGKAHCFSCKYTSLSFFISNDGSRNSNSKSKPYSILRIPSDSNTTISNRAKDWLQKYGLSEQDFDIKWSDSKQALVFSFYDTQNKLIFYQLRFFVGKKRWQSFGPKPLIFLGNSGPIVLVEDILSAIKVSKYAIAVPLFGCTITTKRLQQIKNDKQNKKTIIWLDADKAKAKETKKLLAACQALFEKTHQIISEEDPKAQTPEEIKLRINSL